MTLLSQKKTICLNMGGQQHRNISSGAPELTTPYTYDTTMRKLVLVFVIGAVLLVAFGPMVHSAYEDSVRGSQDATTTTENFTAQSGQVVTLGNTSADNVFNDTVTVQNASDPSSTETFTEPEDYTWQSGNGSILVNSSGDLKDGVTYNVTYTYRKPSDEQELGKDVGELPSSIAGQTLVTLLGFVMLLGAVMLLARRGM